MKLIILLITLMVAVNCSYLEFKRSGLQERVRNKLRNKLFSSMQSLLKNKLKVSGWRVWPANTPEVFGDNSEIDNSSLCLDFEECRKYTEIRNDAVNTAFQFSSPLGKHNELYYVETLRKSQN